MKKERRLSSDDSIATEISDELSVDGGFDIAIEAGAAGYKQATSTNNGDKRKRTIFAFIGLVVVALVVCLSVGVVGLTKRDSDPKGKQATPGTESSADKNDVTQDEKPTSSSVATPTASPTVKPTNAIFYTDGGFECTEHASCRCFDEEVCENRKGVFTTHTLEYDECEKKCLAEEDCNG